MADASVIISVNCSEGGLEPAEMSTDVTGRANRDSALTQVRPERLGSAVRLHPLPRRSSGYALRGHEDKETFGHVPLPGAVSGEGAGSRAFCPRGAGSRPLVDLSSRRKETQQEMHLRLFLHENRKCQLCAETVGVQEDTLTAPVVWV